MTDQKTIHYHETRYGFQYGAADVTRIHSDKNGNVWLRVKTPKQTLEIKVTPTGLIRHWSKKNE